MAELPTDPGFLGKEKGPIFEVHCTNKCRAQSHHRNGMTNTDLIDQKARIQRTFKLVDFNVDDVLACPKV